MNVKIFIHLMEFAHTQQISSSDCCGLAILTLLLGTGIRVSECVGLDLTDVDFKNNTLHIRKTKFSKERYIPIHKSVTEQLCSYHQWIEEKLGLKSSKDPFFYTTGGQKID